MIIQFKPILVEMTAIHELQESAIIINDWMNSKILKINSSKTEFILFVSRQQLNKRITNAILVCGDNIKLQNCIRYLGLFLDDTLDFKEHTYKSTKLPNCNVELFQNQMYA